MSTPTQPSPETKFQFPNWSLTPQDKLTIICLAVVQYPAVVTDKDSSDIWMRISEDVNEKWKFK